MSAKFELLQGSDGTMYLKVYTGKVHTMLKLDENELTDLQSVLEGPAIPFRR